MDLIENHLVGFIFKVQNHKTKEVFGLIRLIIIYFLIVMQLFKIY